MAQVVTGNEAHDAPELCLQPYVRVEPSFDAAAFLTPDGTVSVVAMNKGEEALTFTLHDASLGLGAKEVVVPPHSIQSFVLPKDGADDPIDVTAFFTAIGTAGSVDSATRYLPLVALLVVLGLLVTFSLRRGDLRAPWTRVGDAMSPPILVAQVEEPTTSYTRFEE